MHLRNLLEKTVGCIRKEVRIILSKELIQQLIQNDKNCLNKKHAREGVRYYEGHHDIKDYKLYYFDAEDDIQEDKTRSNIKISHPFFAELVDQKVQYMLSGGCNFVKSDNEELQKYLDEYFDEDFESELGNLLEGTSKMGYDFMYAYVNENDKLRFKEADALGVIEVRAEDNDDDIDYIIWYYLDRIENGTKEVTRVEVWDDKQTYYYLQQSQNSELIEDPSAKINPRPHKLYKEEGKYFTDTDGLSFLPFFRLDNNKKRISDLAPVKALIDDYDLMACGLSNNLQDLTEGYIVVKGFMGDDMTELLTNLKTKKAIGVSEEGDIDIRTTTIPYEARKTKMELDEKNIYRFGMGFNSAQVGDGNVTNIVIKSRYFLLDLKCNKLEKRLKQFLKKIIKVVIAEINSKNNTDFQTTDVYIEFNREVMTNAQDNALIEKTEAETEQIKVNTVLNAANQLQDSETIIRAICEILDIDFEDIKERLDFSNPNIDLDIASKILEGEKVE